MLKVLLGVAQLACIAQATGERELSLMRLPASIKTKILVKYSSETLRVEQGRVMTAMLSGKVPKLCNTVTAV